MGMRNEGLMEEMAENTGSYFYGVNGQIIPNIWNIIDMKY